MDCASDIPRRLLRRMGNAGLPGMLGWPITCPLDVIADGDLWTRWALPASLSLSDECAAQRLIPWHADVTVGVCGLGEQGLSAFTVAGWSRSSSMRA